MVYYHEPKYLFLHIPRTGGGWIQHVTNKLEIPRSLSQRKYPKTLFANHRLLGHYILEQSKFDFDIRYIWSLVRHPISFYESVWGWLHKNPHDNREHIRSEWSWHPLMRAAQLFDEDFNVWVEKMLEEEGSWVTRLFWMFLGPPGGDFCQFVGRTETIEDDFFYMLRQMGYGELLEEKKDYVNSLKVPHSSKKAQSIVFWDNGLKSDVLREERLMVNRWY